MGHHGAKSMSAAGRWPSNRPRPEARAGRTDIRFGTTQSSRTGWRCRPSGPKESRRPNRPGGEHQRAVPVIETPEHIKAAETATREANAPYLTVMLEGKYTDAYLKGRQGRAEVHRRGPEGHRLALDFVGINVYRPMATCWPPMRRPASARSVHTSHPKMSSPWLTRPEVLYWAPKFVQSLWKAKEIYITENGCATEDELAADGNVYDTDRVMFLRATDAAPAGDRRRRAGQGLLPVEPDGQLRVERRVHGIASGWSTWTSRRRSARRSSARRSSGNVANAMR